MQKLNSLFLKGTDLTKTDLRKQVNTYVPEYDNQNFATDYNTPLVYGTPRYNFYKDTVTKLPGEAARKDFLFRHLQPEQQTQLYHYIQSEGKTGVDIINNDSGTYKRLYDLSKFNSDDVSTLAKHNTELRYRPITGNQSSMLIKRIAEEKGLPIDARKVWQSYDELVKKFPELDKVFKKTKDSLGQESFQIGLPVPKK
jgi:hypothetical protein